MGLSPRQFLKTNLHHGAKLDIDNAIRPKFKETTLLSANNTFKIGFHRAKFKFYTLS